MRNSSVVELVRFGVSPGGFDDNQTIPAGTCGTVEDMTTGLLGEQQIWVRWDNGAFLALLVGTDDFKVHRRSEP